VEARAERLAYEIDNGTGHGGGEHEVLALDLLRVWQVLPDLVDFPLEALVEQAVGLVHDQGVEVRALDARVWVGEDVVEAAGGADEHMAALAQRLLQHGALHGAADGRLDDEAGAGGDLLGLDGNLLGQLTGWRDDDGTDVVCLGALVSAHLLGERGVVLDDALDDGDEEAQRLARARLCLCDAMQVSHYLPHEGSQCLHIDAAQGLVDGARLHVRHGGEAHLLGDGVDDGGVH
jgi:hypothetical protein